MKIALPALSYLLAECAAADPNASASGGVVGQSLSKFDPFPPSRLSSSRRLRGLQKEKEKKEKDGEGNKGKDDEEEVEESPPEQIEGEVGGSGTNGFPMPQVPAEDVGTNDGNAPEDEIAEESASSDSDAESAENGTSDGNAAEDESAGIDAESAENENAENVENTDAEVESTTHETAGGAAAAGGGVDSAAGNGGQESDTAPPAVEPNVAEGLNAGSEYQALESQEETGMKPVGKAFLSIAVIGVFAGLIFLVTRRRRKSKAATAYGLTSDEIASAPMEKEVKDEEAANSRALIPLEKEANDEEAANARALILVDTKDTVESMEMVPVDDHNSSTDVILAGEESTTVEVSMVPVEDSKVVVEDGADALAPPSQVSDALVEVPMDQNDALALSARRYQVSDTVEM